jgi:tetratricopeptide (TPR) repeat protein
MLTSPLQSYLLEKLPLAARPWLVAALRQDKLVCQAANDLLFCNFSDSKELSKKDIQLDDWTPASIALRKINPSISAPWLRTSPMPDLDDEIKRQAVNNANSVNLPDDDWSLEKAGWIALAIRSDYYSKGSWEPVLDIWFSDPEAQFGTVLACLYGIVPNPLEMFITILKRNPSAQNIAVVLHAILSNPLTPEDQNQQLVQVINETDRQINLPISARLAILTVLQTQRPQLANKLAFHWQDTLKHYPTKVGWIHQDPLTWFNDLQAELFRAVTKQITALDSASVKIINEWKKSFFYAFPDQSGIETLSELVATAGAHLSNDPQQALHYGQKASRYLIDYLKKIPNPLLSDSRLIPLIQELSELFLALSQPSDSDTVLTLACDLQPANPNLLILSARSSQKANKLDSANQALATALILSPTRIDIASQLAEGLEVAGNWQASLELRQTLLDEAYLSEKPDPKSELISLARCALQANQAEKATQAAKKLLEINPDDGLGYYYLGQALIQMGKMDEAHDILTKSTELCVDNPLPWLGLATFHQLNGESEQVLTTLQAAALAVPNNPDIYLRLGEVYMVSQSYTQAQEALSQANKLSPTDPKIAFQYALVLRQLAQPESAQYVLQQALLANPNDQQLSLAYAECLIELEEYKEALSHLEYLVTGCQIDQIRPYIAYAQVLLTLNEAHPDMEYKPEKAVMVLNKALDMDTENHQAMALLAEAYAACKDYPSAMGVYQNVLDTPLIYETNWSNRLAIGIGRTALALDKPDVAIAALQDVIQDEPDTSIPYRLLAEAYLAAHLPENALRAAQSAILLKIDDPLTASWMVSFLKQMLAKNNLELSKPGNNGLLNHILDDSIQAIKNTIKNQPDQSELIICLSELQWLTGETKAARQSLLTILNNDYAKPIELIKTAEQLSILGDPQAAINCLKRALDIEIGASGVASTTILHQLARLYIHTGNQGSALQLYDQAIQNEPHNVCHYTAKSRLLLELSQISQAIECLLLSEKNSPIGVANPEMHYLLAVAHFFNGDIPYAFEQSRKALDDLAQSQDPNSGIIADDFSHDIHPLVIFTLAAELSRALLQPKLALEYVNQAAKLLTPAIHDQPVYIPYYCLANELRSEISDQLVIDLNPPTSRSYSVENPRLLSLEAKHAYSQGDANQSKEKIKAAKEIIISSESDRRSITYITGHFIDPLNDYLSLTDAAIHAKDWDTARDSLGKASQLAPTNPLVFLNTVKFYVLQAEYQNICDACNVIRHSPGAASISDSAFRGIRNAIASIRELFNKWQPQLEQFGFIGESPLVDRWQARSDLIFEKPGQVAEAIQRLSMFAQDEQTSSYLYSPDDTAAMIAASWRQYGKVDEKTNLAALFQMGHKQSPHPVLLLQIAISLSGHHPLEAMNASQLSTKHLDQERSDLSALCHYYQSYLYYQQGMVSEALEKIKIALSIWSDEPRWNALAAEIKNKLGDLEGAIFHLEEAVKFEPQYLQNHLALGRAYLNGINSDIDDDLGLLQKRAIRNLERATRIAPQNLDAWLLLAQAQFQFGDFVHSGYNADKVLELDADNYSALALKAEVALQSNDYVSACNYAQMAATQDPKDPAAHLIQARALESLNRPEEALHALEKALPTAGNPLPLQLEHVGLVNQLSGPQKALEELKMIASQFPDEPEVFVHLAKIFTLCDDDQAAIQAAQASLNFNNKKLSEINQAQMHHLLGTLMRKTGQLDQAIMHLHKAAQLAPDDVEPYLELGIAHKERREYQQALSLFQQATSIATDDPRPFYMAGLALKEGKDYKRSEVMLRKAANLAPQDVNIRRQLAGVVALNLVHNPNAIRANIE